MSVKIQNLLYLDIWHICKFAHLTAVLTRYNNIIIIKSCLLVCLLNLIVQVFVAFNCLFSFCFSLFLFCISVCNASALLLTGFLQLPLQLFACVFVASYRLCVCYFWLFVYFFQQQNYIKCIVTVAVCNTNVLLLAGSQQLCQLFVCLCFRIDLCLFVITVAMCNCVQHRCMFLLAGFQLSCCVSCLRNWQIVAQDLSLFLQTPLSWWKNVVKIWCCQGVRLRRAWN